MFIYILTGLVGSFLETTNLAKKIVNLVLLYFIFEGIRGIFDYYKEKSLVGEVQKKRRWWLIIVSGTSAIFFIFMLGQTILIGTGYIPNMCG